MVEESDVNGFNEVLRQGNIGKNRDCILLGILYLENSDSSTDPSKENLRELLKKSKSTAKTSHLHTHLKRLDEDNYITGTKEDYSLSFEGEDYIEGSLGIKEVSKVGRNKENSSELGDKFVKDLVEVSEDHFQRGDYDNAVQDAFKLLEEQIRDEGGYSQDMTGSDLATEAFSDGGPLAFGETDAEKEGVMLTYRGAFLSLRNPSHHRFLEDLGEEEAYSILSFANLLLMWLDENGIESN